MEGADVVGWDDCSGQGCRNLGHYATLICRNKAVSEPEYIFRWCRDNEIMEYTRPGRGCIQTKFMNTTVTRSS